MRKLLTLPVMILLSVFTLGCEDDSTGLDRIGLGHPPGRSEAPGGDTRGTYRRTEEGNLEMKFDSISTRVEISVADGQLTFCPEGHGCERLQKVE